jgi:putative endonuclease
MPDTKNTKYKAFEYGIQAEKLAQDYIKSSSYKILATRYKTKYGEIDIIAEDIRNKYIVFFEIKARRNADLNILYSSIITPKQITRYYNTARVFLSDYENEYSSYFTRFDLIIVLDGVIHEHVEGAW